MVSSDQRFAAAARDRGLNIEIRRWPEGARTAEQAARAVGCDVDQIVKSLVFIADGAPAVVLTSGANQVDLRRLADLLGAEQVRKASADEARAATSFSIGGTPPFGYPRPLPVLMDRDLLAHDQVWAAAGTPEAVFRSDPSALLSAAGARAADISE